MMRVMLLPILQVKEEEEENLLKYFRINERHVRLMSTRRKTCQKFSVTDVINMVTMLETLLYRIKEEGMQPLPMLMKIHLTPDLILLRISSSSHPSHVRFLLAVISG